MEKKRHRYDNKNSNDSGRFAEYLRREGRGEGVVNSGRVVYAESRFSPATRITDKCIGVTVNRRNYYTLYTIFTAYMRYFKLVVDRPGQNVY